MDEALKYTAIALAAAICALTVKKQEPAIGSALSMAAGVALAAALLELGGVRGICGSCAPASGACGSRWTCF